LDFLAWFSAQAHSYKILIAGNHELWLEEMSQLEELKEDFRAFIYRTYEML